MVLPWLATSGILAIDMDISQTQLLTHLDVICLGYPPMDGSMHEWTRDRQYSFPRIASVNYGDLSTLPRINAQDAGDVDRHLICIICLPPSYYPYGENVSL